MENRKKNRTITQKAVIINGTIKAHYFDINDDGMYIQTEREFKLKDVITLDFFIEDKKISVKASVRHLEPWCGFGVKFLEMDPDDKMRLRRCLSSECSVKNNMKTVLLIADSKNTSPAYKYQLQQDHFNVMETPNGTEAFRLLQFTKPDIVIMDIQVEGINVFKILQFMKTKPELRKVPFVIFSSRVVPEEMDKLYALGVDGYLVKAVTPPNIFSEKIKQLLNDARLQISRVSFRGGGG